MRAGLREVSVFGPALEAPLVGRGEEIERALVGLDRAGCVIVGEPGVGKSRLAREIIERTSADPLVITATASSAAIPFGAFAQHGPQGAGLDGRFVQRFVGWLRSRSGGGPGIVLIDDAQHLDPGSATLALALVTSEAARLVVTLRSTDPVPEAVARLWEDHGLERIEIAGLGRRDTDAMVESMLGSRVKSGGHARLYELTGGNPLFVDELVRSCVHTGALTETDGAWAWHDELVAFDRLHLLIERRVQDLSPEALGVIEAVAIGEPLRLEILVEMTAFDAVEEVERAGLIVLTRADGAVEVRMKHPLHSEVVSAAIPATAGIRIRRQLAASHGAIASSNADARMRVARWLLEAGDGADVRFIEASWTALQSGDPKLAQRFAIAVGDPLESAVAEAGALVHMAHFDEVESLLAPLEDVAREAPESRARRYAVLRLRALLSASGSRERVRALLSVIDGWHNSEAWRALITTHHAWAALYDRRVRDAVELLEPFGDASGLPIVQAVDVFTIRCFAHARLAQTDECLACQHHIDAIEAALEDAPWELRYARIMFLASSRVLAGDRLEELRVSLIDKRDAAAMAGDESLRVAATKLLGLVALRRGHLDEAVEQLQLAADGLAIADPAHVRVLVLSVLARALAGRGEVERATSVIREADETISRSAGSVRRVGSDIELARAHVVAASGRRREAVARFVVIAHEEGVDRPSIAIEALHAAVRFGEDPQRVSADIATLAEAVQGHFLPLLAEEVCALADRDHDRLWAASRRYDELGLDLYAAEASTRSAKLFEAAGRQDSARRASVASRRSADRSVGARLSLIQGAPEYERLTPREEEVALLVGQGHSNREIAALLVLSVRTVETLVLRACRKYGVSNRRDLATIITR